MNLGRMPMMFDGTVRSTMKAGGANPQKALEGVIGACVYPSKPRKQEV
jgi:hypothetical protein